MSRVNYIAHLNNFFLKIPLDKRLKTTHVSLYLALFHTWNNARFSKEFFINRNEIMQQSRIGSKGTYHKCITDLDEWKYLKYKPSYNPQLGSTINMFDFGTSTEQVLNHYRTKSGTGCVQASGPYININKDNKQYKQESQNLDFLKVEKNKNYNEPL
ncbi:hypothetical protein ACFLSU_02020 [Bacteroidota bacterium]